MKFRERRSMCIRCMYRCCATNNRNTVSLSSCFSGRLKSLPGDPSATATPCEQGEWGSSFPIKIIFLGISHLGLPAPSSPIFGLGLPISTSLQHPCVCTVAPPMPLWHCCCAKGTYCVNRLRAVLRFTSCTHKLFFALPIAWTSFSLWIKVHEFLKAVCCAAVFNLNALFPGHWTGREPCTSHSSPVAEDQDQDAADPCKVSLHLQLERSEQNMAGIVAGMWINKDKLLRNFLSTY